MSSILITTFACPFFATRQLPAIPSMYLATSAPGGATALSCLPDAVALFPSLANGKSSPHTGGPANHIAIVLRDCPAEKVTSKPTWWVPR
jgi:hypothetical protein